MYKCISTKLSNYLATPTEVVKLYTTIRSSAIYPVLTNLRCFIEYTLHPHFIRIVIILDLLVSMTK